MSKKFVYPTDEEFEEIGYEDLSKIITEISSNPKILKEQSVKNIKIVGNKIVKLKFKSETIEKGVNLVKAWRVTCPACQTEKVLYNPFIKYCSDMCGCMGEGSRGGDKEIKLDKKSLNDTGVMCSVSDELDVGTTQSQYSVFFGLEMLNKKNISLDELEKALLTERISASAVIRVKQGKEKNISDYFFDVIDFDVYTKEYSYDIEKVKSLNGVPRDDEFFKTLYAPEVIGRLLSKKTDALLLCQPHKIKLSNGKEIDAFGTNFVLGDPGLAKSVLATKGFCRYTDSPIYSAGRSTTAGLLGGAKKTSSGRYVLSVGVLPKQNEKGIVIDEYGKLPATDISGMNTVESEAIVDVNMCGISVKADCIVNKICIGNLKFSVKNYKTKHKASYDLAQGEHDVAGKFNGASRRRKNHIIIISNEDLRTEDVANQLLEEHKTDFDDLDFWSNLNQFAWSRRPEHIEWEVDNKNIVEHVLRLNSMYSKFELEYGILGKSGVIVFAKQLPAVAILHGSIDGEKVVVKKEHIDWLYNLYDDELIDLGLQTEKLETETYDKHCAKILSSCTPDMLNILKLISTHGSQSAVEEAGVMSRMTIYRHFKHPVEYKVKLKGGEEVVKYYSLLEGSVTCSKDDDDNQLQFTPDEKLPSFSKKDGTLSFFGQLLLGSVNSLETKLEELE